MKYVLNRPVEHSQGLEADLVKVSLFGVGLMVGAAIGFYYALLYLL